MDSRPPCVINWGAGFNCCLPSHSKWWNAEPCVRNASIFTTLCGLPAWLTQTLRLCYLKSTLENGVGNQILLQMTSCFSVKSKKGNNYFSPNFQYFWYSSARWTEFTVQMGQTRVPPWGLTSHVLGIWCGCTLSSVNGHFMKALGQDQKVSGISYCFNK